ncbi:hypothetical protein F0562_003716 [Nyssa sinensis]|uniref:Uncharacterized protein n=1 Tax=Nyssa sinensis TaxID=561372 RepID=A0A5J5BZR9_9ASTE|nr:hypothetical protein F0562_003716 [Nyssa sinensis]
MMEKIKQMLPGGQKTQQPYGTTTTGGKKGVMEKIKEKLPGGQMTQQPHGTTTTGGHMTQQPHGATTTLGGGHGYEEITNTISPNVLPSRDKEDLIKWLPNPAGTFSTKFTWEEVRARYSQVPWKDIIKYSFILWLFFRN